MKPEIGKLSERSTYHMGKRRGSHQRYFARCFLFQLPFKRKEVNMPGNY